MLPHAVPGSTRFLFLCPAYQASRWADPLVASFASQTHPHWRAVVIDDASPDRTCDAVVEAATRHGVRDRIVVLRTDQRRGKAFNLFHAFAQHAPDDEEVVALVDGDDRLSVPHALARLDEVYSAGWEVVWSNWIGSDGFKGYSYHLNPFLQVRKQPFVSTHLFTFRARLGRAVRAEDLQDEKGQWFQAGCDVAWSFPVLEGTMKRLYLDEVLYTYNRENPLSFHRSRKLAKGLVSDVQMAVCQELMKRPARTPQVDKAFVADHIWEFMEASYLSGRMLERVERGKPPFDKDRLNPRPPGGPTIRPKPGTP